MASGQTVDIDNMQESGYIDFGNGIANAVTITFTYDVGSFWIHGDQEFAFSIDEDITADHPRWPANTVYVHGKPAKTISLYGVSSAGRADWYGYIKSIHMRDSEAWNQRGGVNV